MNLNTGVVANFPPKGRRSREASPVPVGEYENIRKHMGNYKYVKLGPPLPPNQQLPPPNQLQIQNQEPLNIQPQPAGHPFLRRAGLIGLGAGLGILGLKYRPLTKLGQKLVNYTNDKFHHLFNPINETNTINSTNSSNSSNQTANRGVF